MADSSHISFPTDSYAPETIKPSQIYVYISYPPELNVVISLQAATDKNLILQHASDHVASYLRCQCNAMQESGGQELVGFQVNWLCYMPRRSSKVDPLSTLWMMEEMFIERSSRLIFVDISHQFFYCVGGDFLQRIFLSYHCVLHMFLNQRLL